jgi:hypothetical protein
MALELGIIFPGYRPLADVCVPLATELARCYWVVDVQMGALDADWMLDNEAILDRHFWDVPALRHSSTRGFRPGLLPRFAPVVNVDEWSYYFAIDAEEATALEHATRLAKGDWLSQDFLRQLDSVADLLMCHVDGWWEFYTGRREWHRRLLAAWSEAAERLLT